MLQKSAPNPFIPLEGSSSLTTLLFSLLHVYSEIIDVSFLHLSALFSPQASELANLKEMMERRQSTEIGDDFAVPGSAPLGADKISQLTREMTTLRKRVAEVEGEAEDLRRTKQETEIRLRGVETERDAALKQSNQPGKFSVTQMPKPNVLWLEFRSFKTRPPIVILNGLWKTRENFEQSCSLNRVLFSKKKRKSATGFEKCF